MTGRNAVYIMASGRHGTLYIGVTSDLIVRVSQHLEGTIPGFTTRYAVKHLVWFEWHESIVDAIQREKSLKRYYRAWKLNLIEQDNPNWDDLYDGLFTAPPGPLSHLNPGLTQVAPDSPPPLRHPRACPEDP